jgi:SAM-dependent methyltransferase
LYDYYQCSKCLSYNYVSDKNANEENNAYFDQHFSTASVLQESNEKRRVFNEYSIIDANLNQVVDIGFKKVRSSLNILTENALSVLEVGFGSGHTLAGLLRNGVDAYGIDISTVAVQNFIQSYPQYRERVTSGFDSFDRLVDVVYCCALFEHLDNPEIFLENSLGCLKDSGELILDGVPVLNERNPSFSVAEDINFWKPCHRVIYSVGGAVQLLKKYGFYLIKAGLNDDFNYRVLSMHLRKGYRRIIELRNPCLEHPDLPDISQFRLICEEALPTQSLAFYGIMVFKKTTSS